jgi:tRNA(Ile)-lysidine synthase
MTATGARSPAAEPPPELVARFKEALQRLWRNERKLGLAVSGGPDSLALLLLAEAAVPGRFEVATVDHGLRPEAADECAFVAGLCEDRGIPCEVLRVTVALGNVQAAARQARYEALAEWGETQQLHAVATAHHADDQAETLLMRLNRGSGVTGLAGVREEGLLVGPVFMCPVIRPLLHFRRSELAEVVTRSRIDAIEDPSNTDDRFDRVRLRKALANADWLDPVALTCSAGHLADADDALDEFATLLWSRHVRPQGDAVTFCPLAPRLMRLRIVDRIIRELGGDPRGGDVARLLDRIEAGMSANLGGVLVTVEGNQWAFRREPPRRSS